MHATNVINASKANITDNMPIIISLEEGIPLEELCKGECDGINKTVSPFVHSAM